MVEGKMKPLQEVIYLQDILSQPDSLGHALAGFEREPLIPLAEALKQGSLDRILLTGMGASFDAAYPAWLALVQAGLPAIWVDSAELIHHAAALVTSRTLLWVFSQSGRSAEVVSAVDFDRSHRPGALLATLNDLESPLACAARDFRGLSACMPIHAAVETTVSTRTYVNSLALGQLAALVLTGADVSRAHAELLETQAAMRTYISEWEDQFERIKGLLGFPAKLVLLGRGASLATTYAGILVLGEAAKYLAVPYQAGEFRHGPLELTTQGLSALVFAGPAETRSLNANLYQELRGIGTQAFWVGPEAYAGQIWIPEVPLIGLPLVEILPIQLLSIHLAQQIGINPGDFFHSGKVTLSE
jgi:glucosamine--fructose-6-phosphate aminotransferase (isomerizing)